MGIEHENSQSKHNLDRDEDVDDDLLFIELVLNEQLEELTDLRVDFIVDEPNELVGEELDH